MKIFSVFDSKAGAYLAPFFASTTGVGERLFAHSATSIDSQFFRYGGDFTLFELGEFDPNSAAFEIYAAPSNLGTALMVQTLAAEQLAASERASSVALHAVGGAS